MEMLFERWKNETNYASVPELLEMACTAFAENTAFFWREKGETKSVSYAQLGRDVLTVAGALEKRTEQHVAFLCAQSYECYVTLLSVMVAGKVAVPLSPEFTPEARAEQLRRADVSLFVLSGRQAAPEPFDGAVQRLEDWLAQPKNALTAWPRREESCPAVLLFTSGTRGYSMGVLLSHGNLLSHARLHTISSVFRKNAVFMGMLPLYHIMGVSFSLIYLRVGAQICLVRSMKYLQREIAFAKPELLVTVPAMSEFVRQVIQKGIEESGQQAFYAEQREAMAAADAEQRRAAFAPFLAPVGGQLRQIIVAAAPLSDVVREFFCELGITVLEIYGMTECACESTVSTEHCWKAGSVGIPYAPEEMRIVDGEIQVRGPKVMLGYYKDEEKTRQAFDGEWLKTGDLGRFDEDGFLYLSGRKGNLILLSNGENVSPEELENALLSCGAVAEVLVKEKDGHIHAEIYPNRKPNADGEACRTEIEEAIRAINRKNPLYKRITSWTLRDKPLERTATMKIRRKQ